MKVTIPFQIFAKGDKLIVSFIDKNLQPVNVATIKQSKKGQDEPTSFHLRHHKKTPVNEKITVGDISIDHSEIILLSTYLFNNNLKKGWVELKNGSIEIDKISGRPIALVI